MTKRLLALFALAAALGAVGAAASDAEVKLDAAPIDVRDSASLQAGARTFVNYCLSCHSASLMRYNRLTDLGLSEQQIKDNLIFTGGKIGETMNVAMDRKDAAGWFGAAPPDLSVTARARGADWLYTYMRGFYRDPSSATGWNNTVFERVGMPHVLWQLQGERVLKHEVQKDASGKERKDDHGRVIRTARMETVTPGTLNAVEYDTVVRDLVAFMVWMAEPNQVWRRQVGMVVVAFLFLLSILTWFLYKEFWKDVH